MSPQPSSLLALGSWCSFYPRRFVQVFCHPGENHLLMDNHGLPQVPPPDLIAGTAVVEVPPAPAQKPPGPTNHPGASMFWLVISYLGIGSLGSSVAGFLTALVVLNNFSEASTPSHPFGDLVKAGLWGLAVAAITFVLGAMVFARFVAFPNPKR